MAPISALWLFSAAMASEMPRAVLPANWEHIRQVVTAEPMLFLASAALGFGVNICTFLVIKTTNSVTLKVLGTARNAGLVLASAWLYDENISAMEASGYALSLVAFAAYNYFKLTER